MFGLTFEKLIIIGVIAAFLLGPERLPHYAEQLGRLARSVRALLRATNERLREETGGEFDAVDWKALDPRAYDPRQIIRDALADPDPVDRPKLTSMPSPVEAVGDDSNRPKETKDTDHG